MRAVRALGLVLTISAAALAESPPLNCDTVVSFGWKLPRAGVDPSYKQANR
jgi:hypothetical protein